MGILGKVDRLVCRQVGTEAIDGGGEVALDGDVFLLCNFLLLLLQVLLIFLHLSAVGVEFLAFFGLGGRKPGRAAVVGSCRLFGQDHHVSAVLVGAGVKVLLGHACNIPGRLRGGSGLGGHRHRREQQRQAKGKRRSLSKSPASDEALSL